MFLKPNRLFAFFFFALIGFGAQAHTLDKSFIYLRMYETDGIEGRFEMHVDDLIEYLGYDLPEYPEEADVRPYQEALQNYILANASFSANGKPYTIVFTGEISFWRVQIGSFVNLHFKLADSVGYPDKIDVSYSVFLDQDPSHVNMLGIEYNWRAGLINNESYLSLAFSDTGDVQTLDLADSSVWNGFWMMIKQGVWHIWIGLDHILFLLALILPSVVRRRRKENPTGWLRWSWEPVKAFKPAFWYILKVVTFFTIAHTITLSVAALEIVVLPPRFVESVIAFSIGLAALHNITPIFKSRDWIIAFGFGLFHGFGFASVLGDLGFRGEFLTLSLLGFNIGVELGQIVIIALIFPILYFIRKSGKYSGFLVYTSIFLIVISLYWLVERAFDINLTLDDKIIRAGGDLLRWLGIKEPV